MKIVAIADTHGMHDDVKVPKGDILVHAGDITGDGSFRSFADFLRWFKAQPHAFKCFVGGNHDRVLDKEYNTVKEMIKDSGCIYLENSGCILDGLNVYGSPITPKFNDWYFMEERDLIGKYWKNIPKNLDLLITHGPPYKVLDGVLSAYGDHHVGCEALMDKINEVKPKYHIFGHIHCSYGQNKIGDTTFINASVCDDNYDVVNKPIVIEL